MHHSCIYYIFTSDVKYIVKQKFAERNNKTLLNNIELDDLLIIYFLNSNLLALRSLAGLF